MHKPTDNRAGMRAGSGIGLAVASMTTVQLGYGLSEPLFDRIGAAGTVALRLALAALILWPFARPRLRGRSRTDFGAAVALGACSGLLTLAFFESISRIPLGVAVTIEFLGPLGVALAGSRRPRDVGWVLAAGGGIALLTLGDGAAEPLDAVGVAFALVSAVCWAGYILLTKRVGARWAGLEGLSVSLVVAALVALPAGIAGAGGELLSLEFIVVGIGLALLVLLPYVFELIALRRLPTALFGVIMSLEPAIAALLGFLILDQELNTTGIVAIAMVSIASAGATLSSREPPGERGGAGTVRLTRAAPRGGRDRPGLPASDADQEQVVSRLREHAAHGRLDVAELEQRIDAAYAARTHGTGPGQSRCPR